MPKKTTKSSSTKDKKTKVTKSKTTKTPKATKSPEKKTAKSVAKKSVAKKAVTKKTPAKKTVAKKTVAKKTTAKKVVKNTKKDNDKKTVAKKSPVKKAEKKVSKENLKNTKKEEAKIETKNNIIELKNKINKNKKINFKIGDHAVYPSHGIGKVIDIEKTVVLGKDFSCYLMYFDKEKLTIKVPIENSEKIGLRKLVSKNEMEEVFNILRSGIKKMKGMWSRRAQEYETKINSGDIIALAEVLRDLARDIEDGERSYSERIIYETAVARLAAEYGAIHKIDFEEAKKEVIATAKDKTGFEEKPSTPKDDFDSDFEEVDDDEDDEFEDDDFEDDDEDDKPRKKRG